MGHPSAAGDNKDPENDMAQIRYENDADLSLIRAKKVAIIRHADVRRMLMLQKSHAEGMRAMILFAASLQDEVELRAVAATSWVHDHQATIVKVLGGAALLAAVVLGVQYFSGTSARAAGEVMTEALMVAASPVGEAVEGEVLRPGEHRYADEAARDTRQLQIDQVADTLHRADLHLRGEARPQRLARQVGGHRQHEHGVALNESEWSGIVCLMDDLSEMDMFDPERVRIVVWANW